MTSKNYEQVGRLYARFTALAKQADEAGLYVGQGFDKEGDFYFPVYDKNVDNSVYYSPVCKDIINNEESLRTAMAEMDKLRGIVIGYQFAQAEAERKRIAAEKEEAARLAAEKELSDMVAEEFIGSLNGSADGTDDKPEMEF